METQWKDWLRELAAAKKGGTPVKLYAHRNTDFTGTITLNADYTGATLRGQVRAAPDSVTNLASFTVSGPTVASGQTTFDISIAQATIEALPADTNADGGEEFPFDFLLAPSGGPEEILFGGQFILLGGVTQ